MKVSQPKTLTTDEVLIWLRKMYDYAGYRETEEHKFNDFEPVAEFLATYEIQEPIQ